MSQPDAEYGPQTKEDAAFSDMIENGMSVRETALKYDIPYATWQKVAHGRGYQAGNVGFARVLSAAQEKEVIDILQLCANWRMALTNSEVQELIQDHLNSNGTTTRFSENKPSAKWVARLKSKHVELAKKLAENQRRIRAPLTREEVQRYFDELQATMGVQVNPANVLTYYEMDFTDDPEGDQVIGRRGERLTATDTMQLRTGVMFCGSAAGRLLSPFVVHRDHHYGASRYVWFSKKNFESFFREVVVPYCKSLPGPFILIGDDLSSLVSAYVITQCQKLNINFVLLPVNHSSRLQPLHVTYFLPFARKWRSILSAWREDHNRGLSKTMFMIFLKEMIQELCRPAYLKAGFIDTGIVPLNPGRVLFKFQPASTSSGATGLVSSSLSASTSAALSNPTTSSRADDHSYAGPSTSAAMDVDQI